MELLPVRSTVPAALPVNNGVVSVPVSLIPPLVAAMRHWSC